MRIVFVRHGEPDYTHDCLTEQGKLQALAAAERLREEGIEEIFSSPLGRAAETAAATAELLKLPVKTLDYMRELHWGSTDGTPLPSDGHPWDLADLLAGDGWDLTNPGWREHPYFRNNRVTENVDMVAQRTDEWLLSLGYERNGAFYRCVRPDDRQKTVALFSHGGSSAAAMGHILNLPFPYACGLFHLEFTGITIIRLDRNPGQQRLPCLELANDGRHINGTRYHRLADM
ncbi:histidine phosphatase family protein [Aristaeella lactis]|uniref:Probable phosphoglycerate mutase n=1 Tax=Aristaeella lactis TaxID=3046383 RepID=A0AC61PQI1_9FIRM|nr:histidine phosphatase family protein [Aristaeella lactis]QUA52342.1 histidine phosphatase family protein [Aristaeella lactis]SMC91579.1 probable phosphoglycerate mutase [Aristaeella lactis]